MESFRNTIIALLLAWTVAMLAVGFGVGQWVIYRPVQKGNQ